MSERKTLQLDGQEYQVEQTRKVFQPADAPRLVIVSHLPNRTALEVLRRCVASIQHFTAEPHEIWVVDNNSPAPYADLLADWPGVNVALNRTEPLPPEYATWRQRLLRRLWRRYSQGYTGSYANAVGLELGARLIDPDSRTMMTLHMDTMAAHPGWLAFLCSKLNEHVAAAGVRMDRARTPEGVLHILGCLIDFQRFRELQLDFWPRLPQYDVGDRITVRLRAAGYSVYACRNSLWEPELAQGLAPGSPFADLQVDRAFDDAGNVIFLHLGRGVRKSARSYRQGTAAQAWLDFADRHLRA